MRNEFISEVARLSAENARLRAALADLRDHGLRFDLLPTHRPGDESFWHGYIERMDDKAREIAERALGGGS